jgi:hypothetical protein
VADSAHDCSYANDQESKHGAGQHHARYDRLILLLFIEHGPPEWNAVAH